MLNLGCAEEGGVDSGVDVPSPNRAVPWRASAAGAAAGGVDKGAAGAAPKRTVACRGSGEAGECEAPPGVAADWLVGVGDQWAKRSGRFRR